VDVRIIAATNRDLRKAVAEGRFREDLFYRLNVIPILIPPLRDRREDIPLLVENFVERLAFEMKKKLEGLSADAMATIMAHDWPGNVRELYNTLRRAYIMSTDEIAPRHLLLPEPGASADSVGCPGADEAACVDGSAASDGTPAAGADGVLPVRAGMPIAAAERLLIEATLAKTDGNKKEAARMLGISLKTLYTRLQVYTAQNG
jgi:DNA-binding NtrC family response regulator